MFESCEQEQHHLATLFGFLEVKESLQEGKLVNTTTSHGRQKIRTFAPG